MRSIRALASALILGAGLLAIPATAPPPAAGIGPLPECRLDDILTIPRDYDSWPVTLVDWLLSVGKEYKPPDLVPIGDAGVPGGGLIREVAIDDLRAMAKAAARNGTPIGSFSAYRSYKQQVKLFNLYAKAYGYDNAVEFSHRPGHSEHQLGLTIDLMAAGADGMLSGDSPTGRWMANNAWKYGWVLSYPRGADPNHLWNETVCFRYEPWHYRYLGRDIAKKVHDSGLTIREYLWTHFTMVDPTTGEPVSTATVAPAGPAIPSASPEVSPTGPPSAIASQSHAPATASTGPGVGTELPVRRWLGADPPVVVASLLLVLTSIGFVALRGFLRR